MSNSKEPAFPVSEDIAGYNFGLTKREYFAGLAMQGYISGVLACSETGPLSDEEAAREAVTYADSLLKELEKTA